MSITKFPVQVCALFLLLIICYPAGAERGSARSPAVPEVDKPPRPGGDRRDFKEVMPMS
jgi:hypothetical protein